MKKTISHLIFFIIAFTTLLPSAVGKQKLNIALLHTFSKPDPMCYDPYGTNLSNGVEMAWADFMKKHKSLPFEVKFIKYDFADSRKKAVEMMDKAKRDNAVAAIGYICSDFAILGGRRAQELGVPTITPSASDDRIADIGDYMFMASFTNSYQGEVMADFAYDELNKRSTLIVKAIDCPYCLSLADAYKEAFEKRGGKVVAELDILQKDHTFEEVVAKTKQYEFDSIFLPNYAMQVAGIIAGMLSSGINTTFLGGDSWLWTEKTYQIIGNIPFVGYSVTTWIPEYPTKISKDFVARYVEKYDDNLGDTAAHSYDAAMLLFNALKNTTAYNRNQIKDALLRTKSLDGVTGKLVFNGRNYPKRPIIVLKTTNNEQKLLKILNPQ